MVKTKSAKKAKANGNKAKKNSSRKGGVKTINGLDENCRKWLRLMADPCSSALCQPCYGGTGSGYLTRTRDIITPPANAVDFLMEFTPTTNTNQTYRYGYAVTTGGSLGTAAVQQAGGLIANRAVVGRQRCVAACIKVLYTGSELTRAGLVSATLDSGRTLESGELITGSAQLWSTGMPRTARMGSERHEILWVPGDNDAVFRANELTEELVTGEASGNSIQVAVTNAPAASYIIEATVVWEWQPAQEVSAGAPGITVMTAPPSGIPLSTILSKIGDIGAFVFSRAAPGISLALQSLLTPSRQTLQQIAY